MTDRDIAGTSRPRSAFAAAARSAAILAIATGAAGTAAFFFPSFDERWVYVAAIAVISEIDGIALAAAAALATPFCYEAMAHGTLALNPERDFLLLGASLVAALLGHVLIGRRRGAHSASAGLAATAPLSAPDDERAGESDAVLKHDSDERITELLREAVTDRDELEATLAQSRNDIVRQREELSAAEAEKAAAAARATRAEEARAFIETQLAEALAAVSAADAENTAVAARAAQAEEARALVQTHLSEALTELSAVNAGAASAESERDAAQQTAAFAQSELTALRDEYEAIAIRLKESESVLAAFSAERAQLESEISSARRDSSELTVQSGTLREDVEQLRRELDEHRSTRVVLENDRTRLESDLLQMRGALNARLADLDSLRRAAENERAKAEQELSRSSAEAVALAARVDEIEAHRAAERDEHGHVAEQLRENLAEATGEAQRLRSQVEELDAARATAEQARLDAGAAAQMALESTGEEIARLMARSESLGALREQAEGERASLAERLSTVERALEDSFEAREYLEQQLIEARAETDRQRARDEAEWDAKLHQITTHLASDHELDIGHAIAEREEARAVARRADKRAAALEQKLVDADALNESLRRDNEALQIGIEQERARVSSEESLRESADAAWDERLQTIVAHLASDHENDMGQALLEKEEARAEARSSSMKLTNLTRTLESERAAFNRLSQAWAAERQTLIAQAEAGRRTVVAEAAAAPLPAVTENRPQQRPSVLLVHRDATLRTMARQTLESSGYTVTTAADGLEAFRVALAQHPDVVLAESRMAKMDGRELVQLLKSRSETAGVKIVLMTGGADGAADAAADFRPDDFLRDPANLESLKATLEQVLLVRV